MLIVTAFQLWVDINRDRNETDTFGLQWGHLPEHDEVSVC